MKTKKSLFTYFKRGAYMLFLFFIPVQLYAGASTSDMNYKRWGHVGTFMPSVGLLEGVVLITGGYSDTTGGKYFISNKVEIYSALYKKYIKTGSMNKPRAIHQAILLNDGKVLVMGGITDLSTGLLTSSCEIFDPRTEKFTFTDSMAYKRYAFTATLLSTGEVLVTGGAMRETGTGKEAEIYDPATGKWRKVASMSVGRTGHQAVSVIPNPGLKKDQILITGGAVEFMGKNVYDNNTAEVYSYLTNTWVAVKPMNKPRAYHIAARLEGTHYAEPIVLVAGGYADTTSTDNVVVIKDAEIYIPSRNIWVNVPPMNTPRVYFTANTLSPCNTDVLVAGGFTNPTTLNAAKDIELFHFLGTFPIWFRGPDMLDGRGYHTATFIPVGYPNMILVSGGAQTGFAAILQKSELIP